MPPKRKAAADSENGLSKRRSTRLAQNKASAASPSIPKQALQFPEPVDAHESGLLQPRHLEHGNLNSKMFSFFTADNTRLVVNEAPDGELFLRTVPYSIA